VGWWRSRNKLIFPFTVGPIVAAAFFLMPQAYYDRLATMNSLDTDGSFQGRLQAWHVAWEVAKNHFPFGAGFYGATMPDVFGKYFAGEYHAAHSIYFQILGDHGFIGLAIYLAVLLMGFVNAQRIRRATRNQPEFRWMYDLATMIQLSLVAFCVGGAGLSMAYDDITFLLIMLLSTMWAMLPKKRPYRSRSTQTGAAHVRPEPRPAYVAAEGRMPRLNPGQ
jgi:probable O-glycosylation ligase (exosortase A-associated)